MPDFPTPPQLPPQLFAQLPANGPAAIRLMSRDQKLNITEQFWNRWARLTGMEAMDVTVQRDEHGMTIRINCEG